MNPEVKNKWLEALRSGKYKQGKSWLKVYYNESIQHCCLGVLCDLYQEEVGDLNLDSLGTVVRMDDATTSLPEKVQKWSGINSGFGTFADEVADCHSLSALNDIGKSFNNIANVIEEKF